MYEGIVRAIKTAYTKMTHNIFKIINNSNIEIKKNSQSFKNDLSKLENRLGNSFYNLSNKDRISKFDELLVKSKEKHEVVKSSLAR
jgi:hypothetical protein